MFIDTHAHVYVNDFDEDLESVIDQAVAEGVDTIYMPNIDCTSIDALHRVEEQYECCHAMMGLHPCYVKSDYKKALKTVSTHLEARPYSAVGEVGVDLYWDKTFAEEQIYAFKYQIDIAKANNLAVIIHSRDALDITIDAIADAQDGKLKGIFHCFNGTVEQARRIIDTGFYMGIGGVVTFKNAGVDKTVAQLPLDNLVLETDAPYLSPTPYRGKRNEPKYIRRVVDKLVEIYAVAPEHIGEITTRNSQKIFSY